MYRICALALFLKLDRLFESTNAKSVKCVNKRALCVVGKVPW